MIVDQVVKDTLDKFIGKVVFFMHSDKIVTGKVVSYDKHQLFVNENYGISFSKTQFFYTEKELLIYLSANKIVST